MRIGDILASPKLYLNDDGLIRMVREVFEIEEEDGSVKLAVRYEKMGYLPISDKWHVIEKGSCMIGTFAAWAKETKWPKEYEEERRNHT